MEGREFAALTVFEGGPEGALPLDADSGWAVTGQLPGILAMSMLDRTSLAPAL